MYAANLRARPVESLRLQLIGLQNVVAPDRRGPTELAIPEVRMLLSGLRRLIVTARGDSMYVYASIALRMLERLEPFERADQMPLSQSEAALRWIHASQRYLQNPHDRACAVDLVEQLAANPTESGSGDMEIDGLLFDLLQERNIEDRSGS
ncbi:MAG: hypothetical protein ABW278_03245 [Steroidobacteraceae bacterium]